MLKKIIGSAAFFLLLSACAAMNTTRDSNSVYSEHQYKSHDVNIAWKSEKLDNDIQIKGAITNTRYESSYHAFELTATLLDGSGKPVAEKVYAVRGPLEGSEDFTLDIPVQNAEQVQRVKISYTYDREEDHFTHHFESAL